MTAVIRGLYYSYTITSQSYLTARSIINSINALNKPYIAAEPDTVVELVVELVGATTVVEYYIGSTTFYCIANYH
jgi:hypothetical protein